LLVRAQDLLIDRLNEQLKGLHDKFQLYDAQLLSQREETDAAGSTLADANREMEQIAFEKKQLLNQWRSALLGMQRRDEALQATLTAIQKQREQVRGVVGGASERERLSKRESVRERASEQEGEREDKKERTGRVNIAGSPARYLSPGFLMTDVAPGPHTM
jgi:septal ring factor EnvC (AmiA/AmiB activator)